MTERINHCIHECEKCREESCVSNYILYRKPCTFYGSENPCVMLLGHSPAVRTWEEAEVVLKMNKHRQPLYKYITGRILKPLGISIEQIYCTNLIKCQTSRLPEDIDKSVNFFERVFSKCRELFELEVKEIKPQLIISFSETVLEQLSRTYTDRTLKMKESFGELYYLDINGYKVQYIPVVHLPKINSRVEEYYFPEQTDKLKMLRDKLVLK